MEKVISIQNQNRIFSLDEAQDLVPLLIKMTAEAQRKVTTLLNRKAAIKFGSSEIAESMDYEIQAIVDQWHNKLTRLGVHPKGLWLADFDHGKGYYCWKYPEALIKYGHGYKDGFSGRTEI